ncbi:MAG: DNA polymerase Y family protein [Gammaproteobacteria bacterium]|nr:DNA polymerase Y family protein [Gammaproteobacteria bacterium]
MSGRLYQLPLLPRTLHVVRPVVPKSPTGKRQTDGRRTPLWYAVCLPQLMTTDALACTARQAAIAELLGSLSANVSIEPPDSFVFEVRSTLNYFGGIQRIRNRLQEQLLPLLQSWGLPGDIQQAASPTPAASLLLAQAGCNVLIHRPENLRSALGRLPVQLLPQPARKSRQLHNSGLRRLRDLWRLPQHGLRQRFGADFVGQLDRCLGKVASPIKPYQSPPLFRSSLEFEYAVENTQLLLHGAEELLARLCGFLRRRELAATYVSLTLEHEHRQGTALDIELRQPTRAEEHLRLLVQTHLDTLVLPAPVLGIQIEVRHFEPFQASVHSLSGIDQAHLPSRHLITPLLERLQARLGNAAVCSLLCRNEHRPEQAGQGLVYGSTVGAASSITAAATTNRRPCWLLPEPLALRQEQGRLYYRSSLRLLSGPERIETGWWSGQEIRRDYYVAGNRQGMQLWIFHERCEEHGRERNWFLHGIFD